MPKNIKEFVNDGYDKIVSVENDIKKIQQRPEMYVGTGKSGCIQLCHEGINNAIDECTNPESCGENIEVVFTDNKGKTSLYVADDGRGIPSDVLMPILTVLNTSSKFYRENGDSAGENGCGFKAIVALSEYCKVITQRPNEKTKVEFKLGETKGPKVVSSNDGVTGTSVLYEPSEIFMGKDAKIDMEILETWIRKIMYLTKSHIKLHYKRVINGKTTFKAKYQNKHGLVGYIKEELKHDTKVDTIMKPISLYNEQKIAEEVILRIDCEQGKQGDVIQLDRTFRMTIGMAYHDSVDYLEDSFCNFINTTERGSHIEGVKAGVVEFLRKETEAIITKKDSKELTIMQRDIERGLSLVVSITTDLNPQFIGQIKGKVGNGEFFKLCRRLTIESLKKYFDDNPSELKAITTYIKINAKARLAENKARKAVVKEDRNLLLASYGNANLKPANNKGANQYRELIIFEGDSASAPTRYDNGSQALFLLRGYPKNSFKLPVDKLLENKEFKNLILALQTNIGTKFNPNKCYYDKIIIMPDSDSDGSAIFTLMMAFFLCHMPQLIERGKIYKSIAPLYSIKGKNKGDVVFVNSKMGYIELFEQRIADNIKIYTKGKGKEFGHESMQAFLYLNRNYTNIRNKIAAHYGIHKDLVEFIAYHIVKKTKDFNQKLFKEFKELSVDKNIICGVIDNKYQMVVVDDLFVRHLQPLMKIIEDNDKKIHFGYKEKVDGKYIDKGEGTIGRIMDYCNKFTPVIIQRYKGLGELTADELCETSLNPYNRQLYQVTMDDAKEAMKLYDTIHGKGVAQRQSRKDNYTGLVIDPDMLDN